MAMTVWVTMRIDGGLYTEVTGAFTQYYLAELFNHQQMLDDAPLRPHGMPSPYEYDIAEVMLDESFEAYKDRIEQDEALEHALNKDD